MTTRMAALLVPVLSLSWPARVFPDVVMTEQAALARAFPGVEPERRTLYLTNDQVNAVQKAARSKLPSPVITSFEARSGGAVAGRAYLDTHVVRTMPETVMAVVLPDGRLKMALVLQFAEPPDYLPREGWLATLEGRGLDTHGSGHHGRGAAMSRRRRDRRARIALKTGMRRR
jgi:hypothetical protein